MRYRKRFPREFKREAVRLSEQGQRPAAEIARELGIPRNRLYKWQIARPTPSIFSQLRKRGGNGERRFLRAWPIGGEIERIPIY